MLMIYVSVSFYITRFSYCEWGGKYLRGEGRVIIEVMTCYRTKYILVPHEQKHRDEEEDITYKSSSFRNWSVELGPSIVKCSVIQRKNKNKVTPIPRKYYDMHLFTYIYRYMHTSCLHSAESLRSSCSTSTSTSKTMACSFPSLLRGRNILFP